MNKASGGDGILVELFQILKDDSGKVLYSVGEGNGKERSNYSTIALIIYASKFSSFQSLRKAMPKNA